MSAYRTWKKFKSKGPGEFSDLYHELQVCWERGWKYEADWCGMSAGERAHWLAFVGIESWRLERDREAREREAAVKKGGAR